MSNNEHESERNDVSQGAASAGAAGPTEDELTRAKLPPPTIWTLTEMLASQAMVFLGLHPDPVKKAPVVRLNFARHYIDSLGVLEEKTRGNLTSEEAAFLEHVLHDLRMAFVAVQRKQNP